MRKLDRNEAGVLLLPLAGEDVPEDRLTDVQFLDWVRVTCCLSPMSVGEDCRGRNKGGRTLYRDEKRKKASGTPIQNNLPREVDVYPDCNPDEENPETMDALETLSDISGWAFHGVHGSGHVALGGDHRWQKGQCGNPKHRKKS